MTEFMQGVLVRYEEAVGTKVVYRKAATPFFDEHTLTDAECTELGSLAPFAASVLMKVLWGARMARWDLLRQVAYLAGFIHRWTLGCDKKALPLDVLHTWLPRPCSHFNCCRHRLCLAALAFCCRFRPCRMQDD